MRNPMKKHRIKIVLLLVLAVLCIAYLYFFVLPNSITSTVVLRDENTTQASTTKNMVADVYPLYESLTWGDETPVSKTLGTTTVQGFEVSSQDIKNVTDISGYAVPFRHYFDEILSARGWKQDPLYDADGAGSSEWTYTKGSQYIVLSYESASLNQAKDQPFSCPCTTTFEIFSGSIVQ